MVCVQLTPALIESTGSPESQECAAVTLILTTLAHILHEFGAGAKAEAGHIRIDIPEKLQSEEFIRIIIAGALKAIEEFRSFFPDTVTVEILE